MSFLNKVVLVTGASSGIGAATAIAFAKEGARIVMVGRNEEKLKNVYNKIEEFGNKPLQLKLDVTKEDNAKKTIEETVKNFQKLDILVNDAGITREGTILDGKLMQTYDEVMNTNLKAAMNLTTLAVPYLQKSKGNIVNISSVVSLKVTKDPMPVYSVSKAALDMFTKRAAQELARIGIRVNSVNPGPIKTDILRNSGYKITDMEYFKDKPALKRISEPEEIADLILFLAGEKAKGITGSIYVHDNGTLLV